MKWVLLLLLAGLVILVIIVRIVKGPFRDPVLSISVTRDRFELREDDRLIYSVAWSDVMGIIAFKQDLFSVDRICLTIVHRDGKDSVLHEEMQGWQAFVDALPDRLPDCMPFASWFDTVAFPAFKLNPTRIFERSPETPYR
jgi:hypothetical protein